MADEQILEQLRKSISGTFEVHQSIAKFKIHRTKVSGEYQTVHVEIFDAGEAMNNIRYHCIAWPEDDPENIVTGNPDSTIQLTLTFMHWNDLDK